jgi:hypothetical protein
MGPLDTDEGRQDLLPVFPEGILPHMATLLIALQGMAEAWTRARAVCAKKRKIV